METLNEILNRISRTKGNRGNRLRYKKARLMGIRSSKHRILAELALGKPLPPGAEVHHLNGKHWDNNYGNLVICPDHGYHMLLHERMRQLKSTNR